MVIWSKLAQADYWDNIDYLLENWSEKEAQHFINRVEQIISLVDKTPQLFQQSEIPTVHRVPVVPQITLYYRFTENSVELLRFWNNYQDEGNLGW